MSYAVAVNSTDSPTRTVSGETVMVTAESGGSGMGATVSLELQPVSHAPAHASERTEARVQRRVVMGVAVS